MSAVVTLDELIVPITIDYLEEDGVYKVSGPSLQGCHAWGETLDAAMRAIPGNIKAMLEARRANGSPIPTLFKGFENWHIACHPVRPRIDSSRHSENIVARKTRFL